MKSNGERSPPRLTFDVTDKIERRFTWIGESEWDNRRALPLKRFRWSELRSVSRILPIRPRLPHGLLSVTSRLDQMHGLQVTLRRGLENLCRGSRPINDLGKA